MFAALAVLTLSCSEENTESGSALWFEASEDWKKIFCLRKGEEQVEIVGFPSRLYWKRGLQYGTKSVHDSSKFYDLSVEIFADETGKTWSMAWISNNSKYLRINNVLVSLEDGNVVSLEESELKDLPYDVKEVWVDNFETHFRSYLIRKGIGEYFDPREAFLTSID